MYEGEAGMCPYCGSKDIQEFHIDNHTCNFTTELTIEENPSQLNEYYKGSFDFLMDEIGVRITAKQISIVSIAPVVS